ncbi:MAG: M48 family metallopeptidase [Methylococcales bacterium]|nr:M48 family metallopeptidase [Methylococcales bacterium]
MNTFTYLFLVALAISFGLNAWLAKRHSRHIQQHRAQVPTDFQEKISLAEHQKAADYTLTKLRLGDIERIFSLVLLVLLTLGGVLEGLFAAWQGWLGDGLLAGLAAIASLTLLMTLVGLPFELYQTFVIEQRFGFNKSTPQQYCKDQLLQLALMAVIGLPLLALILWLMASLESTWWLVAWAVLMGFSVLMSWLYPTLIAPLFNEFTPLEEGSLRQRIENLLKRCEFSSQGIFIMDGSKRSGHGNAYFTGFGDKKRIVFFDTLVASLSEAELEAVLAHELGHFKRKHVIKMLIASSIMTLIGFAILGFLSEQSWFYSGLGVATPSNAAALVLFTLVMPVFTPFLQPISAYFQRQFEFEADAFAAQHSKADLLISSLVKLYQENASTLTPDPLYSAFHYSHPPAAVRINHLKSLPSAS